MATQDISYVASGLYDDCINLLDLFKSQNSLSFGAFTKVWKDLKFPLIFVYRKTFAEVLEFCEESLNIAKQLMLSDNEFIEQVFGLYLLYGLYYKIPVSNMKIKVTLKEWFVCSNLHNQIREYKLYDASFIYVKLVTDNAFYHCLFSTEHGLEKMFKSRQEHLGDNSYSVLQYIVENIETGGLAKVGELGNSYEKYKAKLLNFSSNNRLHLFEANFLNEMIVEMKKFQGKQHPTVELNQKLEQTNVFMMTNKSKYSNKIRPKLGHGFDTDSSNDDDDDEDDYYYYHYDDHNDDEYDDD
ncbi:uncharacterized protein LOC106636998, partial [Copidosoma floridanum]|uniref:uncharacterized protein LOC106636998 n=1 Tax=Copidosoma floridanum TaxID=29053 RepID=UPI000C6F8DF1